MFEDHGSAASEESAGGKGSGAFTSSLTDLMTSLAIIFILLFVVVLKQANDQARKAKDTVRAELDALVQEESLALKQDPKDPLTLRVAVGENQLKFGLGSSRLTPDGSKFVAGFFGNFATKICGSSLRDKIDSVVIEGYTDRSGETRPEGTQRNIQLSQERSYAVLTRALASVESRRDVYQCLLDLTSASGRGSTNPVVGEGGKYEADKSRRVEIKIRVRSSEQQIKNLVSTK